MPEPKANLFITVYNQFTIRSSWPVSVHSPFTIRSLPFMPHRQAFIFYWGIVL